MSIEPLYDRILVKRIEEEEDKTSGGIIVPDSAKEKPQEAEIVAVGKGKMLENGEIQELSVDVGDRIILGKYTGTEIKYEGQEYLIMREDDVLAKIA